MSDTKQSIISGTKWTTLSTLITNVVGILKISILTRLLAKSDFGLIAILTMVLEIIVSFSNLGFATAIMHKQDLTKKEFCSLYWIQFFTFLICYVLIILLAYPVSLFYEEPKLFYLLPISGLGIIFNSVGNFYSTLFQKNMNFRFLSNRNIMSSLLSLLVAVVLAYYGFGVLSLVISDVLNALIFNIWNFVKGQQYFKMQFFVSYKLVKPLVRIGLYQTGTRFLDLLSSRVDIFIISKFLGTETLGMYNIAKSLVLKVVTVINGITNTVALPYFSSIQNDENLLRKNYLKVLDLLSHIDFPICVLIGALSCFIVPVLYGESYNEIIPIVSILSIWSMLCCMGNPVGNIINATGRTDLSFKYTVARLFIVIPCVIISAQYSILLVAVFQVISILIVFFVLWRIELWETIHLKLNEYICSFIKKFIIGLSIGSVMFFVSSEVKDLMGGNIVYSALICGFLLCSLYVLVYAVFYKDILMQLKMIVMQRIKSH